MANKIGEKAYENKKRYIVEYRKKNTKEHILRFIIGKDDDIIAKLDSIEGCKMDYFRDLIRKDIENSK